MDSLLPLPKPCKLPGGRFRGILLGQLLHHVRTCESGHWDKSRGYGMNFNHGNGALTVIFPAAAQLFKALAAALLCPDYWRSGKRRR